MPRACGSCGADNGPSGKFCTQCGAPLPEPSFGPPLGAPPPQAVAPPLPPPLPPSPELPAAVSEVPDSPLPPPLPPSVEAPLPPPKKGGGKTILFILLGLLGACCLLSAAVGLFLYFRMKDPSFLHYADSARQKAAVAQLHTIGASLDAYRAAKGVYPPVNIGENTDYGIGEISALKLHLEPEFIATLPETDPWGNPLLYGSTLDGNSCALLSMGVDGSQDEESIPEEPRPTSCYEADLIWANGQMMQYPEGQQSRCQQ